MFNNILFKHIPSFFLFHHHVLIFSTSKFWHSIQKRDLEGKISLLFLERARSALNFFCLFKFEKLCNMLYDFLEKSAPQKSSRVRDTYLKKGWEAIYVTKLLRLPGVKRCDVGNVVVDMAKANVGFIILFR